ncbi:MAG TPA: hypothetical protein PLH29_00350 [bacterium]|nr:hypothetical protein [bacterium]
MKDEKKIQEDRERAIVLTTFIAFEILMGALAFWLACDDVRIMLKASFIHQFIRNFWWSNVYFIAIFITIVLAIQFHRHQLTTPFWKKRGWLRRTKNKILKGDRIAYLR